jgi:hypothetical protein
MLAWHSLFYCPTPSLPFPPKTCFLFLYLLSLLALFLFSSLLLLGVGQRGEEAGEPLAALTCSD